MTTEENTIKATLRNIEGVQIKSKVTTEKNETPKVVTSVNFDYDGKPSTMESILDLAAKGLPIHVKFYTPQLPLGDMLEPKDFSVDD